MAIEPSPSGTNKKFFLNHWKKITNDPAMLEIVSGWNITFSSNKKVRKYNHSALEKNLINQEVVKMLDKRLIRIVEPCQTQFLSNLFLREKKDGSQRPIINLNN